MNYQSLVFLISDLYIIYYFKLTSKKMKRANLSRGMQMLLLANKNKKKSTKRKLFQEGESVMKL
jgi:hypothetical protein